jgi:peptidase M28-like protein
MRPFKKAGWRRIESITALGVALMVVALGTLGTLKLGRRGPASFAGPIQNPKSKIQNPLCPDLSPLAPMPVVCRLCSDAFAGRKAGTPGADRAAAWLAAELRRIGLEPAPGAPHFRQPFTMPVSLLASQWDRKARLTGPAGATTLIEYPCFHGGGFSEEARAIFAGSGVSRRDQGWDDYQGRKVRGKYVIYREEAPAPGLDREEHGRWRDAHARGALGCLILSRQPDTGPIGLESPIRDFPVLRLDPKTAQRLFGSKPVVGSRQTVVRQKRRHFGAGAPTGTTNYRPPTTDCLLRIDIPRAEDPARPAANIIGMIPGTDPRVADEAVLLSAHYDHLGAAPGALYPGADDDASGVAVVLGAARALRQAGARPRRPILFCLWTAEECGLLGSQEYVDHPLLPLDRTRFVLQVEMVGAGRTNAFLTSAARLAGTGHAALSAAAADLGLTLAADTCRGVSDHMPFIRRGVPALVITTTGDHPDYHTPRDTPDRLHPAGIENATRLCAQAIWREANE